MTGLVPFNMRYSTPLAGAEEFCDILNNFFSGGRKAARRGDVFKIDVEESPEAFKIQAEVPGVKKEEIGLELNDDVLTISVKKGESAGEEKKNYLHRERRTSFMSRSIRLAEVKAGGVKARLEDGILSVTVEKELKVNKAIPIEIE